MKLLLDAKVRYSPAAQVARGFREYCRIGGFAVDVPAALADAGLDHDIDRTARQNQMLDIVPPDKTRRRRPSMLA